MLVAGVGQIEDRFLVQANGNCPAKGAGVGQRHVCERGGPRGGLAVRRPGSIAKDKNLAAHFAHGQGHGQGCHRALARGVGMPEQNDLQRGVSTRLQVSREIPPQRLFVLREQCKRLLRVQIDPPIAVESEGRLGGQQADTLGRALEVRGRDRRRNRGLVYQSHCLVFGNDGGKLRGSWRKTSYPSLPEM